MNKNVHWKPNKEERNEQIVVLRDFLIIEIRRSFQKVRVIRKDKYNFAKHSKEWVENSGIQEKNGLFMKFTTQKQLFAKLKQLKQV